MGSLNTALLACVEEKEENTGSLISSVKQHFDFVSLQKYVD